MSHHVLSFFVSTLAALFTSVATAATYTHGVGLAGRAGMFAGISSQGAEINLRANGFEFAGGVMTGKQTVTNSNLDMMVTDMFGSNDIETATITQNAVTGIAKLHPMNGSFYFGLGGAMTDSVAKLRASSRYDASDKLERNMRVRRMVSTLSIGNIWTPGGVIIGCEWLGAHGVISKSESTDSTTTNASNENLNSLDSSFQRAVRDTSGGATSSMLMVHLGYMIGS